MERAEGQEGPVSTLKCASCGYENPANLKFCGNCGAKFQPLGQNRILESLALFHIGISLYLIVSIVFNLFIQLSVVFAGPYLVSGLLGLYVGREFYRNRFNSWLKTASAIAVIIGLITSAALFLVGPRLVGPVWVLFLINGWLLWRARKTAGLER